MQHNRNPFALLSTLLLALCAGSGLEAQQAKSVIDVQAVVNGILAGETTTTSPHLDHNQDGLINVIDVQHVVGEVLNPPPPQLMFGMAPVTIPINQFWGVMMAASGGAGPPYTFTHVAGTFPPGLDHGPIVVNQQPLPDMYTYQIRKTPTQVGNFVAIVELEDSAGNKFQGTIDITVVP